MTIWTPTKIYNDQQMQRLNLWVADMMEACEAQALALGVSIEVIVGQAALESNWGRSAIGHNIFGIKADAAWHGPVLMQRTAEQDAAGNVYFITAAFRDYPTYKGSVDDHFDFLKRNTIYAAHGVFTARTDQGYAQGLEDAGYATAKNYAAELLEMRDSVRIFTATMETSDRAAAVSQAPPAPRLLTVGSQGNDVVALQDALAALHFYPADQVDGDFGAATAQAVRQFQQAKQLVADGIVGQVTRAAMGLS